MAHRLASDGYRVVAADMDIAAAERVAGAVAGKALKVDAADYHDNHRMVAEVIQQYGRLDVAVLNVGINSGQRGAQPLDLALYRRCVSVNLDSVAFASTL